MPQPRRALVSGLVVSGLVRGMDVRTAPPRMRTGLARLDRLLGGGLPRGVVTELVGAPSSGRTTLAYATMAAVTAIGGFAACIDLPDAFDPEHAGTAGIDLARMLWIRPRDLRSALRASEQLAGAGGFELVLVDLDGERASRVSAAMWLRLARAAERSGSVVVVVSGARARETFATVRLETKRRDVGFTGGDGPCPLFDGILSVVYVQKNKLGSPAGAPVVLFATATA